MDIKSVIERKSELESQINDLIWGFEQDTGTEVREIRLERVVSLWDEDLARPLAYELKYISVLATIPHEYDKGEDEDD